MERFLKDTLDYAPEISAKDCLFRILNGSGRVLWQITNTCNYNCGYCIFSSGPTKEKEALSTIEIFRILLELKQENFSYIKLTGGEPFVRRDILGILEKVSELGFSWDISTNGSLITSSMASKLSKLSPDFIHVSLDGPDIESHEAVRGTGTFAPTFHGIKELLKYSVPVRIGSVLHRDNESKIEKMCEFAINLGVKELVFSVMEPLGRIKGDYSQYIKKSVSELLEVIGLASSKNSSSTKIRANFGGTKSGEGSCGICPGGKKFLFIDHLGSVSPCTWGPGSLKDFRSEIKLKTSSLHSILQNGAIARYRDFIVHSNKEGKTGCPNNW